MIHKILFNLKQDRVSNGINVGNLKIISVVICGGYLIFEYDK